MQTASVHKLAEVVEQCNKVGQETTDTISRIAGMGNLTNDQAVMLLEGYARLLSIVAIVVAKVVAEEVGE